MEVMQRRAPPMIDPRNARYETWTWSDMTVFDALHMDGEVHLRKRGPHEGSADDVDAWISSVARRYRIIRPPCIHQTDIPTWIGEFGNALAICHGCSRYGLGTRFKHETGGSSLNNSRPSVETFYAKARRFSKARDLSPLSRLRPATQKWKARELENGLSSGYGLGGLEDRDRVTSCRTRFKYETGESALNNSPPSGDDFYAKARGDCENCETDNAGGGIRGLRPHVLTPPPALLRPVVDDMSSTWDLLNLFCPQEGTGGDKESPVRPSNEKDWSDGDDEKVSKERTSQRKGDSDSCLSTSVEDEESEDKDGVRNILSAKILEPVHNVSPNGSFRRRITSWQKGELLGSGSFGTVYEGVTE